MTDVEHMVLLKDLTDQERLQFQGEYNLIRKNPVHGVLFAIFFGGLGAHRYYLGHMGIGVLYTLFCWTFIPSLIAFVEIFLMSGRVKRHNTEKTREIVTAIRALRN